MHRVALIGCGDVAEHGHLPALLRHRHFAVTAVCDISAPRLQLLSRIARAAAYSDWRQLLDREPVDAAVLALPPEVSPDVAISFLQRGIAVLDEKPLAATVEDGLRVATAVRQTRSVYQIGFVLRYGSWVRRVARLAKAIGTPARMRIAVYDERLDRSDTMHFERIQGFLRNSSAMTHEGSHVIDYASLWNPAPWTQIRASAERTETDLDGPNLWHAAIQLADSSTLELEIGWLLPEIPPCSVAIHGPNGFVELNPVTGIGSCQIAGTTSTLALTPMRPEWDPQYEAFDESLRRGTVIGATVQDGLRALEVTAACERAARTGETVVSANAGAADTRGA